MNSLISRVARFSACALALACVGFETKAAFGVPIPPVCLTNWTPGVRTGVIGGNPTNRTYLIDVPQAPYNANKTEIRDASAATQSAINAAGAGDVVYLPAGTYRIDGERRTGHSREQVPIATEAKNGKLQNLPVDHFGVTGCLIILLICAYQKNQLMQQRFPAVDQESRAVQARSKVIEERDALSREKLAAATDLLGRMENARCLVRFPVALREEASAFNILLVEDEKAIHYYKDAIEEEFPGARVQLANNGVEAWAKIINLQPSLVITDLVMPVMNGFQLISKLRDCYPEMPVLAVSAYVDCRSQISDRVGNLPRCFGFLPKPITSTSLFPAVRRLLASQSQLERRESAAI